MEGNNKEILIEVNNSFDFSQFVLYLSRYEDYDNVKIKAFRDVVVERIPNTIVRSNQKFSDIYLKPKEVEVLNLLSLGFKYSDIATKLGISINGVRYYVKKIYVKLNVTNSRDAVRIYLTELSV